MPWVQSGIFGLMWLLVTANNIASLVAARKQGGSTSLTLFIGGIFGAIAVLALPLQGTWPWMWLPALLDPGSLPALYRILSLLWRQRAANSPSGIDKDK